MTSSTPPAGRGRPEQRAAFIRGLVDHVLAEGLGAFRLRPAAAALGTSDRMLLYYFGSREGVLAAVLDEVADQLRAGLVSVLPAEPLPPGPLLSHAWAALRDPTLEPHLRLYVELDALAARGDPVFAAVARRLFTDWTSWLAGRLDLPPTERAGGGAALLALIDGLLLTRFVTDPADADRAVDWLVQTLTTDC